MNDYLDSLETFKNAIKKYMMPRSQYDDMTFVMNKKMFNGFMNEIYKLGYERGCDDTSRKFTGTNSNSNSRSSLPPHFVDTDMDGMS